MSDWSNILGTINLTVIDFEENSLSIEEKQGKISPEIKNLIKNHFGQTLSSYEPYSDEKLSKIKVPIGSEGSISYTIADATDYNRLKRFELRNKLSEYAFHVTFSGALRDRTVVSDGSFLEWVKSIPKSIEFNEMFKLFIDEDVWMVTDDLSGTKTYFNLISSISCHVQ